ncbi:MAG: hypothetical protein K2W95_36110 [Candidatus Obscuribacterales bacterium]|nr:hypothetical protein [Candidatus Obscuribacterales bacterium]
MNKQNNEEKTNGTQPSSDRRLSRSEFLKKVMLTGGVISAPVILDKFLVQPAAAASSRLTAGQIGGR